MKLSRTPLSFLVLLAGVCAGRADPEAFASPQAARVYISSALPAATRANPKYTTKSDGAVSQWLTDAIIFRTQNGETSVAMREHYFQNKKGVDKPGKHTAVFSLEDVDISDFTEPGDVTPAGDPSRGLLFRCAKPGCVAANWDGAASHADKTDVSIQDDAERARLLAAFQFLKDKSK